MAGLKGKREFEKFERGEKLTWKQSVRAQCYACNGFQEGMEDCKGDSCPLYVFFPYKGVKKAPGDGKETHRGMES